MGRGAHCDAAAAALEAHASALPATARSRQPRWLWQLEQCVLLVKREHRSPLLRGSRRSTPSSQSRTIAGWKGSRAPRCAHCNRSSRCCTTCLECSTAFALVVVHKDEVHSQHGVKKYACLIEHARNPAASKRTVASRTKSEAARSRHKRRREEEDEEDDE